MAKDITTDMMPFIRKAAGLVIEAAEDNNAASVGSLLNIPVILNAKGATELLKSGAYVTVDAKSGVVSCNEHEK